MFSLENFNFTSECLIDQEERVRAVEQFRAAKKDVLVATDVASKGLDFQAIKHVINYDMPEDIENYGKFHQIRLSYLLSISHPRVFIFSIKAENEILSLCMC